LGYATVRNNLSTSYPLAQQKLVDNTLLVQPVSKEGIFCLNQDVRQSLGCPSRLGWPILLR